MDPFTQVKSAEYVAKFNINSILNRGTFCGFSVTPMSKCRKRPRNLDEYKNSLLLDHRLQNAPIVPSKTSLPWFKASRAQRREENKVEFLERQFHNEKLSFFHEKESEHSFELSLSICIFYRRIFNVEMQNFGLNERAPAILLVDVIY